MTTPLFTIVIPVFNNAHTIEETISSLKGQRCQDWECILIDDYSEDDTWSVVEQLIKGNSQFRLVANTLSKGANTCRNIGMRESIGQYLIFLDGDDIMAPHCLTIRREHLLQKPEVELLISSTIAFTFNIQNAVQLVACKHNDPLELLCVFVKTHVSWTTTGATWERAFITKIGGFNEKYPRLQDVELNIRALMHSPILGITDNFDSYYRLGNYTLAKQKKAITGYNLLLRDYYDVLMELYNQNDKLASAFSELIYLIVRSLLNLGDEIDDEQRQFFLRTLQLIDLEKSDYELIEQQLYKNNVQYGIG